MDSIQYVEGMRKRPEAETTEILEGWAANETWIIDGFGSLKVIERRFERTTAIVFVDFPLWRHYWWATKRQFTSLWRTRTELPSGCTEAGPIATWTLFKILWRVHVQLRPKLIAILESPDLLCPRDSSRDRARVEAALRARRGRRYSVRLSMILRSSSAFAAFATGVSSSGGSQSSSVTSPFTSRTVSL